MIQGTGSNVGKSVLVAGICRALVKRGLTVRPFKPQNMSNNAAVTVDGGEIGRAQALQALACGTEPHTDMNPVLLKPETETGAQVIVQGKRLTSVRAREYAKLKPTLMSAVLESFQRLSIGADCVVVEGAGSPAEINLRAGDIANMGFAEAANIPVVLAGDIDRGGVIAQLVGTHAVLPPEEAARIKGFVVNKFRGDVSLFDDGAVEIAERTGWKNLGVIPWFKDASKLPAEDILDVRSSAQSTTTGEAEIKIAVPQLARIANFDDLDPLRLSPGVSVHLVPAGQALPGNADLIILPGSKSTRGDLEFLRAQGWDIDLQAHVRRGGHVLGICGGYQMLGRSVADPEGIEGPPGTTAGLGFLDITTIMQGNKRTDLVHGRDHQSGLPITGYEIHIGLTEGPDCARPWLSIADNNAERLEGAMDRTGRIRGCYVHGMFGEDAFRSAFLEALSGHHQGQTLSYSDSVEATLDVLAAHLEEHVDIDALLAIAQTRR
ncbi:MAG: cobyric acid synthase [Pseudomonadota bacterium]